LIRVVRSSEATEGFSPGINGELTVTYRTDNGTAEAGEDYELVSGTLVWLTGDASPK